jgi:hypothetical protein
VLATLLRGIAEMEPIPTRLVATWQSMWQLLWTLFALPWFALATGADAALR